MLRHVVLLTLEPGAPVDEIADALRALPAQIPGIEAYEVLVDAGLAEGNATIGVVAGFVDEAAWRAYLPHPAHEDVVQRLIAPHRTGRSALQATLPSTR